MTTLDEVVECIRRNSDSMGVSYLQPGMDFVGDKEIGFWGYNNPKFPVFIGDGVYKEKTPENREKLVDLAIDKLGKKFMGYYLTEDIASCLQSRGFTVVPIGYEIIFSLDSLPNPFISSLKKEVRNQLEHADRAGFEIKEITNPKKVNKKHIEEITYNWLSQKSSSKQEMKGTVRPFFIDPYGLIRTFWLRKDSSRSDLLLNQAARPKIKAMNKYFDIEDFGTGIIFKPKKNDFGYMQLDPYFEDRNIKGYFLNLVRARIRRLVIEDQKDFNYFFAALPKLVELLKNENVDELNIGMMPFYKKDVIEIYQGYKEKFKRNPLGLGYVLWMSDRGNDIYGYSSLNKEKNLLRDIPGVRLKPFFSASHPFKSLRAIKASLNSAALPSPSLKEYPSILRSMYMTLISKDY